MKIIQEGGFVRVTCQNCNSLLEIAVTDVIPDDIGQCKNGNCYCKCLSCKSIIEMNSKSFPFGWSEKIYD